VSPRRGATRSDGRRDNGAASVVDLALDGLTASEIAARLGVHRSTVWRQLTEPTAAARLAHLTSRRLAAQEQRLAHLGEQALDVVEQLLADEAAPPAVRLRAAHLVLERTLPATIQAEIRPAQGADVAPLLRQLVEGAEQDRRAAAQLDAIRAHQGPAPLSTHDAPRQDAPRQDEARAPSGHAGALNGAVPVAHVSAPSATWRLPNARGMGWGSSLDDR
jgi:AcrR family transcriptional regulator